MGFITILKQRNVLQLIGLYASNTLFSQFIYSTTPFWLEQSTDKGGLGLTVETVANTFLGIGLPMFFFQIWAYPCISKKLS